MNTQIRIIIRPRRRSSLKAHGIRSNSRKSTFPQPSHRISVRLQTEETTGLAIGEGLLVLDGEGIVLGCEPYADEEDVAREDFDALLFDDGLDLGEKDCVCLEGGAVDVVFLGPGVPVYEYTSADDASIVCICCAEQIRQGEGSDGTLVFSEILTVDTKGA